MTQEAKNNTTYLWFDYETFGANAIKDRPAQFGAVRTDASFNVLGRPIILYSQLADDYLPSAGASLITGITPMTLLEEENVMTESDFAESIYQQMIKPGTISIGFNSINFDDTVTRFLFWRNLIPPYTREKGEGRGRFDLFPFIKALYAFYPDTLTWPKREDGLVSMRLENLSKANGLSHEHAHDASSDAYATMLLAKLIYQKKPKIWEYALTISRAENLVKLMSEQAPLLYVDPFRTHERSRGLRPVFPLMESPSIKGTWVCWDLNADPSAMMTISAEDMKTRLFVKAEDREKGVEPLPFVMINLKKQPFLVRGIGWVDKNGKGLFDHDAAYFLANAQKIREMKDRIPALNSLFAELAEKDSQRFDNQVVIPEEHLYFNNFPFSDRDKMTNFRMLSPMEMAERLPTIGYTKDELTRLTLYFMARNWPEETLEPDTEAQWRKYKMQKLVNGYGGSRTFEEFFSEIDELEKQYADDEAKLQILEEVREYGENLLADYQG